ncbi:hypothetical protein N0V88_002315 [Collariella sp. IMI 366227]|nr:hypothetical protein N0V88_002315 [Collariella sp. IMI 366227]
MDILKSKSESSEPLLPVDAREKTDSSTQAAPETRSRSACKALVYIRRTIVALSLLLLVLLGVSSVSPQMPCHNGRMNAPMGSPNAVEAVHPVDVPVAVSLVPLARRDESNSTIVTVPSSTAPVPSSSSSVPPPPSTTSVPPPPSTTESSNPPPSTTSTPPSPSSTLPATTTTPPRTSKEVVTTLTTTSPNGDVVTITSTTFVAADGGRNPCAHFCHPPRSHTPG